MHAQLKTALYALAAITLLTGSALPAAAAPKARAQIRLAFRVGGTSWVDPASIRAAARPLLKELARRVGTTYSLSYVEGPEDLTRKLRSGEVNYIASSALDLTMRAAQLRLMPLAVAKINGATNHRVVLITRRSAGLTSLTQLKGKSLSLNDQDDTIRVAGRVLLARAGIKDPVRFFRAIHKKRRHKSVLLEVLMGEADAGLVTDRVMRSMAQLNPQIRKQLRVTAQSAPLSNPLVFARVEGDGKIARKMGRVANNLHKSDSGRQLLLVFTIEQLAPVSGADLETTRTLWRDYRRLVLGEKGTPTR